MFCFPHVIEFSILHVATFHSSFILVFHVWVSFHLVIFFIFHIFLERTLGEKMEENVKNFEEAAGFRNEGIRTKKTL